MAARRTAWHFFFGLLLRDSGPAGMEQWEEVLLSEEPPRIDYLLLRTPELGPEQEGQARTLRRLWPELPRVTVMEFKSVGRPYRGGQLDRLWGYTHVFYSRQCALPRAASPQGAATVGAPPETGAASPPPSPTDGPRRAHHRGEVCSVLVVPRRTPSLEGDIAAMGLRWEAFGPGYWRVRGGLFALFVVEIDVAAPADQDEVLYSFGHGGRASLAARRFWSDVLKRGDVEMNVQEMDDFDEVVEKLALRLPPQKLLAHFPPEQRLAGLPPEERLAGLDRDHAVLALPIEMLRALSEDYLRSLSPEAQAEIQRRLGKNGHAGPSPNGR